MIKECPIKIMIFGLFFTFFQPSKCSILAKNLNFDPELKIVISHSWPTHRNTGLIRTD